MEDQYYKTPQSVKEYIAAAEGYDGKKLIHKLHGYLPPASTLLEIGSGPGTDFEILKQTYSVVGSDFSEEFIAHLKTNHPTNHFLTLDAETLVTDHTFDGIYSNKVLQHLTDEGLRNSINRQKEILHAEGIICHSFWKGDGDEMFKGLLVNYQTPETIQSLFGHDFDIVHLEAYQEFEEADSLLLIGRKKQLR